MTTTNWEQLIEDHEVTFLRADICIGSPESYTLDEKRAICKDMEASTETIDAAMRKDFQSWPPQAQDKMLDLLLKADPTHFEWWKSTLIGTIPDTIDELTC